MEELNSSISKRRNAPLSLARFGFPRRRKGKHVFKEKAIFLRLVPYRRFSSYNRLFSNSSKLRGHGKKGFTTGLNVSRLLGHLHIYGMRTGALGNWRALLPVAASWEGHTLPLCDPSQIARPMREPGIR